MYPILVHNLQQMIYFDILNNERPDDVILVTITRPQDGINHTDITDIIPKYIRYHPCIDKPGLLRKYIKRGFTDIENLDYLKSVGFSKDDINLIELTNTEINIIGNESKFYLSTKDNHDPLTLARLLLLNCLVLMEKPDDQDLIKFYKDKVIFIDHDSIKEECYRYNLMKCSDIKSKAIELCTNYRKTRECIPDSVWMSLKKTHMNPRIALPEDKYQIIANAPVTKDKDGNNVLKLSPTNGADSLPEISIIVINRSDISDADNVIAPHMIERNRLDCRYPDDKIEYIVQGNLTLRNCVKNAKNDIIILVDPTVYYFPYSYYAKAKLLTDNESISVVGSTTNVVYNIIKNKSYCITSEYPPVCTLAFKRKFYLDYVDTDAIDVEFYKNRKGSVANIDFTFNSISIETLPSVVSDDTIAIHHKLFSFDTKEFITMLYRKLTK